MEVVRVKALVSGRVQGVVYRASTRRKACELGLSGWVRNLPDGRVELEAQGNQKQIDELLDWCRNGPPSARVGKVDRTSLAPVKDDVDFKIRL